MANLANITNNNLSDSGINSTTVITGSGTTNFIPKLSGTNTIVNSSISDDGGIVLFSRAGTSSYVRIQGTNDGDNYGALELFNNTATNKWQFAMKSIVGETNNFTFNHYNGTSWSSPFTISNGNNVLIGTTNDNGSDKLQVNGTSTISASTTGESPMFTLNNPSSTVSGTITSTLQLSTGLYPSNNVKIGLRNNGDSYFYNTSGGNLRFGVNGITGIGIYGATGNVSIGQSTDNGFDKLQVNGDVSANGFKTPITDPTQALISDGTTLTVVGEVFTPSLASSPSGLGTITTNTATFTQIGNIIAANIGFIVSTTSSTPTTYTFTFNLPVARAAATQKFIGQAAYYGSLTISGGIVDSSSTTQATVLMNKTVSGAETIMGNITIQYSVAV